MTTIAYHHGSGIVACDGRSTQGSYITTDKCQKWLEIDGEFWFFTGCVSDRDQFIAYQKGELSGAPTYQIECSAFIVSGGKCYEAGITQDGQAWRVLIDYDHATGSGKDHAVAAMDHGKGAPGAVEYAITRDSCSGGVISVFDIASMRFLGGSHE